MKGGGGGNFLFISGGQKKPGGRRKELEPILRSEPEEPGSQAALESSGQRVLE